MIFITGPLYAGKREYIRSALGLTQEEFAGQAIWDVQELAAEADDPAALEELAAKLSERRIVIATEVGGGVVPTDRRQREAREKAGRLGCLLAARADSVVYVCCGLPQLLKGEWPC